MSFEWGEFSPKALTSIRESDARINIFEGSVRSGKTINSIVRWLDYVRTGPSGDLIIIGKTERTVKRNILDIIQQIVGNRHFSYNRGLGEAYILGRKVYIVGASDERSEGKIRGMTLAGAYGDELTLWPKSFFKMLLSRLSVKGAKLFGTTNPEGPYYWLKTEYIDKAKNLDLKVFSFRIDDNRNLDQDYVEALKKEYTGLWYKRFILGLWVVADGIIYDMFSDTRHQKPTIERDYIEHYVSCDYGTYNTAAFGLWGKFEKQWYKVKEYHYDGRTTGRQKTDEEYYKDLATFIENIAIKGIIVDPSAASFITTIKKHNQFRVIKAKNQVLDGIRNVATALSNEMILYNDCCIETFREYASYIWDEKASQRGEDKPIKQNDHHMDCDRYFINTILFTERNLRAVPSLY